MNEPTSGNSLSNKDDKPLKKFPIARLNSILKECSDIVANDVCLPGDTRKLFNNFTISFEETNVLWNRLRPVVDNFIGNAETFYAEFYGLLTENILKNSIVTTQIS